MGSAKQSFFTIKKGRQTTMIFQSRIKGGLSRRAVLPAVTFLVAVLTVGTHASSKRQTHVTGQTDVTGQTQATGQTGTYELNEYVTMCGQRLRELQNLKWRCSNSTETPQKVGAKGILVNPRSRVQTTLSQTLSKYYRQEIEDKLPQVPQKVVPFLNAQIKATQDEIAAEQKSLNKYYKTMKKIEAIRKCNLLGDIKDIFWNSAELVIKGMVATHTRCGEQELTKRVETFTRCTAARTNMEPEKLHAAAHSKAREVDNLMRSFEWTRFISDVVTEDRLHFLHMLKTNVIPDSAGSRARQFFGMLTLNGFHAVPMRGLLMQFRKTRLESEKIKRDRCCQKGAKYPFAIQWSYGVIGRTKKETEEFVFICAKCTNPNLTSRREFLQPLWQLSLTDYRGTNMKTWESVDAKWSYNTQTGRYAP